MTTRIMVLTEHTAGQFRKVSLELVSEARRLADETEGEVTAIVIVDGSTPEASELGDYGADTIIRAQAAGCASYPAEVQANLVKALTKEHTPDLLLFGATTTGREISARVAAGLNTGLLMDSIGLKMVEGGLLAKKPLYGGKVIAEFAVKGSPKMVTLRPNVAVVGNQPGKGDVFDLSLEIPAPKVRILEMSVADTPRLDLTEAEVVVAGGRGMGGPDFSMLEELAALLGGAVGASRNAVDEGWRPASDQVGQTGKVVSPNLYVACGISGAMQHLAGMNTSKCIVAINTDRDALIFRAADYCIVDDLFAVIPAMTAAIRRIKAS
jgi:electron transfer flavoprotein alpha subunit